MKKLVDKRNKVHRITWVGTAEECKSFRKKHYALKEHPLVVIMDAAEGDEALPVLPKDPVTAGNEKKEAKTFEDASKMSKSEHQHGKEKVGSSLETSTKFDKKVETPVVEETTTPVVEETTTPVVEETTTPVVEETTTPVVEETVAEENLENTEKLIDSLKEQGKMGELIEIKHRASVEIDGNNVIGVELKVNEDGREKTLSLSAGEFKAALKIIKFFFE